MVVVNSQNQLKIDIIAKVTRSEMSVLDAQKLLRKSKRTVQTHCPNALSKRTVQTHCPNALSKRTVQTHCAEHVHIQR